MVYKVMFATTDAPTMMLSETESGVDTEAPGDEQDDVVGDQGPLEGSGGDC